MEFASLEREIYIEASPDIVFDVVSDPVHVTEWWPDEARYDVAPGSSGEISFGDKVVGLTVVDVRPPTLFSFRWTQPTGEDAIEGNSLLVTFTLTPSGSGTTLTMVETGFREMGWDAAVLEETYQDHVSGWDHFVPRIAPYAEKLQ
ncbi:SRPBCC family protein [Cryptosporangium sp. NPDC048952]|uniref:SRPBCC family protein n=1 Tax=Cryptosporangium sp. NPDC048952 TaxID=3363961 RepID=UPI00371DC073